MKEKRRGMFMHLKRKADVICIQETHSDPETEYFWRNEFGGNACWSSYSTQARGVGILVKRNQELQVEKDFHDSQGRLVGIQFKLNEETFTLINVYAPNEDDPNFWIEVFRFFEMYPGHRILVSDYNLALDKEIDRSSLKSKNNDQSTEILNQYMTDTFSSDLWRNRNIDKQTFTYCTKKPFIGSRIDYVLVDTAIESWFTDVNIIPGFRSDHAGVTTKLLPHSCARGRGYWKLNNQILYEINYVTEINNVIDETVVLAEDLTPDKKWEMVKRHCIATSQVYSHSRASERKLIISQLEEQIQKMTEKVANDPENQDSPDAKLLQKTIQDYEVFMAEKTQSAIFRSGAKFYSEGEKSTKYFFQLEKFRSGAKGMNSLINNRGEIIKDQRTILAEQRHYYKKLYTKDPSVHFDFNNETEVKLTPEEADLAEGEFTLQEIHSAIKNLKRGSCPGCDGLTTEFYARFYTRIKQLLCEAFNYCYNEGQLYDSALRGVFNLIPKHQKDPRHVESMRPITILPTDYKIVEKVLAQRIKPLLDKLINSDQKGFMASCRIQCNIRRIFDLIEFTEEEWILVNVSIE